MRLGSDPEGVVREFDELDQTPIRGFSGAHEARSLESSPIPRVELVAVTVALGHHVGAVDLGYP